MTLDDEARRGTEAERLLEHPLLAEAFSTIAKELETAWRDSPAKDEAGREKLWVMRKLLDRVESHLKTVAVTGQLARRTLGMRVGLDVSPR